MNPEKPREIPDALVAAQMRAADPDRAVFVSANAGSGKTHVLTQRVINLLLEGVDPAKILCITYTKAAAANMANRVFETLAEWTRLDDAAFDARIAKTTGKAPDAARRIRARRLFATALETPGGLKVQTIHAFCTRLLHQFPFEANVAARFEVLDEASTAQLLDQLTLEVMLEAAADPDGPLGKALATAITAAADVTFMEVIAETIRKRDLVIAWVNRAGSVPKAIAELDRAFGLSPGETLQGIDGQYLSSPDIPQSEWPALIAVLQQSDASSDRKHAERLAAVRTSAGRDGIDEYIGIFCTGTRKRRENVTTKAFAKKNPEWAARLAAEQDRVCDLVQREHAARARDRSAALLTVASTVIGHYAAEKDRRGLLDYDDLIGKTLALFENTAAAWVLYKLDLGIDHVLVDEAQDTSPKQWQIIKTIVAEFVPGGARDNVKRTMFAVGDEKQSIFSFQGAAPKAFAENRKHFAHLYTDSDIQFIPERLDYSFRSAHEVLRAVDEVFRRREAFVGLTEDPEWTLHHALPDAAPGEVEIWDVIGPDAKDEGKEGWDAPFDTTTESSPAIKLAAKIGRTVKRWCASGTRPRDVLILVRQRGPVFEAVIRALKREGIAVAGADRLVLTDHIAVMDLLVLGDALLLSDDDLALATVLRSPLFGFDDDQLFKLAYGRTKPLRTMLRERGKDDPMFESANRALDALGPLAHQLTPFSFYAHVLGALHGRKRFLARLGADADDPLDEFLNLALDYERRQTPSLQGFLHWVRIGQNEVKRDMEIGRDEVRVMTVHGAKGLEAKRVILIDATTVRPEGAYPPRLLETELGDAGTALIWGAARDKDAGPMAAAREKARDAACDEYRRLLYVGMTRAADHLVICATKGVNKFPEDCWYQLICDALKPIATEETDADGDTVWRMRKGSLTTAPGNGPTVLAPLVLPDWALVSAPAPKPRRRRLRPSADDDEEPQRFASRGDRDKALRRGTLLHRLMQSLPDIAPERRDAAARTFLSRDADLSEAEHAEIATQVFAILNDARFAPLFAPGSRAEVSVAGLVGDIEVPGQIDRLAVTERDVIIADYKTNRPAPRRIEDVPPAYMRQLALYRALLQKIYPGKNVRAALLWSETPELMELSSASMDAALAKVTSA
jgi:ATP-dependent helicase/nuclease subunit A